jgi:nematocidal protein AidA
MDEMTSTPLENIHILFVVDTGAIATWCKDTKIAPSQDPAKPTALPSALNNSLRFICDSSRGIVSGQGAYNLNFKAKVTDVVSFVGTSIEANSNSAVIVYGFTKRSGADVFNPFHQNFVERDHAVVPTDGSGVPPALQTISFASYDSSVKKSGTESFDLSFAQYSLKDDNQTQALFGYFIWDPTITVS